MLTAVTAAIRISCQGNQVKTGRIWVVQEADLMAAVTAISTTQMQPGLTWQLIRCRASGCLTATHNCGHQAYLQGLVILLALLAFTSRRRLGTCSFSTLHATRVYCHPICLQHAADCSCDKGGP